MIVDHKFSDSDKVGEAIEGEPRGGATDGEPEGGAIHGEPNNEELSTQTISLPWIPGLSPRLRKIYRTA